MCCLCEVHSLALKFGTKVYVLNFRENLSIKEELLGTIYIRLLVLIL